MVSLRFFGGICDYFGGGGAAPTMGCCITGSNVGIGSTEGCEAVHGAAGGSGIAGGDAGALG